MPSISTDHRRRRQSTDDSLPPGCPHQRYREYLAGSYELPANEIYQLGFRIALAAGLVRVDSFDNRDIEWQAEAMAEATPPAGLG